MIKIISFLLILCCPLFCQSFENWPCDRDGYLTVSWKPPISQTIFVLDHYEWQLFVNKICCKQGIASANSTSLTKFYKLKHYGDMAVFRIQSVAKIPFLSRSKWAITAPIYYCRFRLFDQ